MGENLRSPNISTKQVLTCFPQVCPRLLHQQSEKLRGGAGIAFTWGNDFDALQVLYDKIADLVGNPRVPVVLVGNKKDLEVKKRNLVRNMKIYLIFIRRIQS